ncbi:sensor histidine kinase [Pseudobacteroides cellulosolvens]|uniref:sensor histidine kinase n=1 Tax=Pseudobacteroides cellulosolvens TaxID=35825 RepID=UPI001A9A3DB4|nr:HAMP domain-containing sensor histidine kinase [Pseudobacteroides cellulosolvens]
MIILFALLIVGLLFSFLARFYTERQAKNQLIRDATSIYNVIATEQFSGKILSDSKVRQAIRQNILPELRNLESNFTLISRDYKIIYPRDEEAEIFKNLVLPKIQYKLNPKTKKTIVMKLKINNTENFLAILPSNSNAPIGLRGWFVLYSPVGPVQKLIRSLLFVLAVSLVITAIIAVLAGVLVAGAIAKPIIKLKARAEAISKRKFDGVVEIHTRDELEDLAVAIEKMAVELKEYDLTQKRFFQNASHELKTPLMSIQGYAEGIKDGVFENNEEALEVIAQESSRLKGVVEELIFLSKLESQDGLYVFSETPINKVIEKSIEKLTGIAIKENIKISLTSCDNVYLNIDSDKIIQALINVIGNCLRYAKSEIKIICQNRPDWLEIKINDDGNGFDESEISKLFERFYKGKKGKSGLGLAITRIILEKHGGSINASNASNGGAEFTIKLPRE